MTTPPRIESKTQQAARKVLEIEAEAIQRLIERIDDQFDRAIDLLYSCRGRVVATGMGKSGIICRKLAATLASTGTPSLFLHPAEALHGDLGMIVQGDVVVALSNSGETQELIGLLEIVKRLGVPLIAISGDPASTIARSADVVLDVSVPQEACAIGVAPTASTTAALALGDALAIALSQRKGFRLDDFARLHPGGKLGKRLARVGDLMQVGDQIPRVRPETRMADVIYEMSSKGMGVTGVVDADGRLMGVISDGDLRRLLGTRKGAILDQTAESCMSENPISILAEELASSALNIMEEKRITSLMVLDAQGHLEGIIHLHHLWGTEIF